MRVPVLVGPTAVGKSRLGLALAEELGGEIVNADALQVYRGLDIGTAKPTAADRRRIPHHLVDILDPVERYSAGTFARLAVDCLEDIAARGRQPIVVGGSGLYVRALTEGLAEIPEVPDTVRDELQRRCEREGLEALRQELILRDPELAQRLEPADTQRTLRALAVLDATGRPLSWWQKQSSRACPAPFAFAVVGVTLPREELHAAIASRVEAMLRDGWVEEVRGLLNAGVPCDAAAFQAIGYRRVIAHLEGRLSLAQTAEAVVTATRQYAKRQLTWYRRQRQVTWLPPGGEVAAQVERARALLVHG